MANTIKNFAVGDKVSHLSNSKLAMVVIAIKEQINEISCRWVDIDGKVQRVEFLPEELEMYKKPTMKVGII